MSEQSVTAGALNVLVVDDEANIRRTLAYCLEADGHRVTGVASVKEALVEVERRSFDLALVDLHLGPEDGLELLPPLLAQAPWLKIVIVTAFASIDSAVEAMRRGAFDYLPKPFEPEQVRLLAHRVAEVRALESRLAEAQQSLQRLHPTAELDSTSPAMQRALALAREVAPTEAVVLLCGESGTGKTLLARAIHGWSTRAAGPLAVVSCPSLSPELLESELFGHVKGAFSGAVRDTPGRIAACNGGTLFLDEVGELSQPLQAKLLRFLQDREYERVGDCVTRRADVRILAATNRDLAAAVREGRFREDLYYRLNVFAIDMPPLRARPDDVLRLAEGFLAHFGAVNHRRFDGFTPAARDALHAYVWPGNVRELRNVVERAAILCRQSQVGPEVLPDALRGGSPAAEAGDRISLAELEARHIRRVLAATSSLQEAAAVLGIDPATLWRKRKQYGL